MNLVDKSLKFRDEARRFLMGWLCPDTLASETARDALNSALKDHWKPHPIEVYELILEDWNNAPALPPNTNTPSDDRRFIVFIDPELDVDWISNRQTDTDTGKCISTAESVGARRCKHLPREQVLEFKRLIAQAIVNGIRGDLEQSCELADDAAQFLKDRTVERSRGWTLSSAHFLVLLLSIIFVAFYGAPNEWSCCRGLDLLPFWLAIQGGMIGAYLSVLQKAASGEWDAASGIGLHILEVFTKLIAGAVLGGIAFALSRSVHSPPSLRAIAPDGYAIFLLGVAAGLFERVIPKMISAYTEFPPNTKQKPKK